MYLSFCLSIDISLFSRSLMETLLSAEQGVTDK